MPFINPRTACELVANIHGALHTLVESTPQNGEELHAFCAAGAVPLGLYGGAGATEFFAALDRLEVAIRGAKHGTHVDAAARTQAVEISTQSSQLVSAAKGVEAAGAAATPDPSRLPTTLWTGVLVGRRPTENREDALATLDSLCAALEYLSRSLKLECFLERNEGGERTHTLTSGGMIFVLDVELGMYGEAYTPSATLKLSYASDNASQSASSSTPGDVRLVKMLESHLCEITNVLFGAPASPTPYARLSRLWAVVSQSLETLAYIDGLTAKLNGTDLFTVLESLGAAAERVSLHEAAILGHKVTVPEISRPDVMEALVKHGHGVALLHVNTPYLEQVYHLPANGPQHSATIRNSPIRLRAADTTPHVDIAGADAALTASLATRIVASTETDRVCYVAHLRPPVTVPHRALRTLWRACGLDADADTKPQGSLSGTPYVASRLGIVTPHDETVTFSAGLRRDEARVVSILPFQNLAQLYAALGVLRDYVRVDELLARVQSKPTTDTLSVTLELSDGPGVVASFVTRKSEPALVTASIEPQRDTWRVRAESGGRHLDNTTAAALGAKLASGTSLGDVMRVLHEWA